MSPRGRRGGAAGEPDGPGALLPALREQARRAVVDLAQAILDDPRNNASFARFPDGRALARGLFEVALLSVHHLLFQLKRGAPSPPGSPGARGLSAFGDGLCVSEDAVARALDHLRSVPSGKGGERRPVDHGALTVEDLGRVHEGLLGLSPGIAAEPMRRLRRRKLEIVVPAARADEAPAGRRDVIPEGSFYLRAGLGRKASGSYYTPAPLVRFLIQETLGPHVEARSPAHSPDPAALLGLRVLDPAMGTGCFLVEACRFLGGALVAAWAREGSLGDVRHAHGEPAVHARRLVARHCLFGVDRDPLAVELARLSLWLEAGGDEGPAGDPVSGGAPPAAGALSPGSLSRRLVRGDSLSGPFFEDLLTLPSRPAEPLPTALVAALAERLHRALLGGDPAAALSPFRRLAAAWSGAVMLGEGLDEGYAALARAVAGGDEGEAVVSARPPLARAVETGLEGVSYDLTFPDVFWPRGRPPGGARGGFSAVVGNPPWDAVRRNDDQFFAAFDLGLKDLPTRAEKRQRIDALAADPAVAAELAAYLRAIERKDRIVDALHSVHRTRVPGGLAGRGTYDDYMLFAERAAAILAPGEGRVGMLFPSAFHASEGAAGVRRLYFRELRLACCFSFENRRRLFEIDGRFKFAVVVARAGGERAAARVAFYLQDPGWLFGPDRALRYDEAFIARTGGEHLSLLELRSPADLRVAEACFEGGEAFGAARARLRITTSQEINMTHAAHRFTPASCVLPAGVDPREPDAHKALLARGYVPLHEGKTFHQYTDRWDDRPRHLVALAAVRDRPGWTRAARYFRLAFRDIASSTNERTGIFCLLPPGVLCGNKAPCERDPSARPDAASLTLLAIANTFSFDHLLRSRVQSTVNLFLLDACPVPPRAFGPPRARFLAHAALRLSCNHAGYLPLWRAQLGPGTWREKNPVYTWPVLGDEAGRRAVRAAADAVVAEAYGLSREQYAHVLSSFRHRSWPDAPDLCLAAFDELATTGLEAFARARDPYGDVPLVEAPPEPVIDLMEQEW